VANDGDPPDGMPPDPMTPLSQMGSNYHEMFLALQASGFSEDQAFELMRTAVFAAFGGHL
jgi:hypothetical protein